MYHGISSTLLKLICRSWMKFYGCSIGLVQPYFDSILRIQSHFFWISLVKSVGLIFGLILSFGTFDKFAVYGRSWSGLPLRPGWSGAPAVTSSKQLWWVVEYPGVGGSSTIFFSHLLRGRLNDSAHTPITSWMWRGTRLKIRMPKLKNVVRSA